MKFKKIPKKFQRCLWSYNIEKMDLRQDKNLIIAQVLNYGTWDDLKLLYKIYPEKEIREVVQNPSRGVWFKKVLNFWCRIFNIKLKKEIWKKAIFNINPHL